MTAALLLVSLTATVTYIAAGLTYLVKKVRRQWIPNAVFIVWASGAGVSLLAHVILGNWLRAAMPATVIALVGAIWLMHQVSRRREAGIR